MSESEQSKSRNDEQPYQPSPGAEKAIALGKRVGTGEFGADMKVSLINDGPVTICMDTNNKE